MRDRVRDCQHCKLCATRTQTVFGVGDENADWMFIGEGPGENEDLQGRPFVGKAGQKLEEMIKAMGLSREAVFIANIVKCRPPNNRPPPCGCPGSSCVHPPMPPPSNPASLACSRDMTRPVSRAPQKPAASVLI